MERTPAQEALVRVIGVVDLLSGRAVHAQAGRRDRYGAVRAVGGSLIEAGHAPSLAAAYIDRLGLSELYVADLDAILGGTPQSELVAALCGLRATWWLDAGVSTVAGAERALGLGARQIIVALETLQSFEALERIRDVVTNDRIAFGLDLRGGTPVVAGGGIPPGQTVDQIVGRVADIGVGAIVVVDLARVGRGTGVDLELVGRVRAAAPEAVLIAGGGIRDPEDLERLAESGCDGALVATALHDGRIGRDHIAAASAHRSASR